MPKSTFRPNYFSTHYDIAKRELTKVIMEDVTEIVQSPKPVIEMRRRLISCTKNEVLNRLIFTEEFNDKKHLIFDHMNRDRMKDDPWTEEKCFNAMVYSEAEVIILRLLQIGYFEDVPKNDWWKAYVPVVEREYKYLYQAIIGQAENREALNPVDQELFKLHGTFFPHIEKQLLGDLTVHDEPESD